MTRTRQESSEGRDSQLGRYDEAFTDPPSSVVHIQAVGVISAPYEEVVRKAIDFAAEINSAEISYTPLGPNSNSYALSFVEHLGFDRPQTDVFARAATERIPSP